MNCSKVKCETYSPFTLARNGYEPVHGIVLKNGPPPFTLTTIIGVSIAHAASSQLTVVAMAISQFYKCMSQVQGTNCMRKTVTLERFCLY